MYAVITHTRPVCCVSPGEDCLDWSGSVGSPTFYLDEGVQGIVSAAHAERIVTHWLEATGLFVIDVHAERVS